MSSPHYRLLVLNILCKSGSTHQDHSRVPNGVRRRQTHRVLSREGRGAQGYLWPRYASFYLITASRVNVDVPCSAQDYHVRTPSRRQDRDEGVREAHPEVAWSGGECTSALLQP